jgi:hypothetical protein
VIPTTLEAATKAYIPTDNITTMPQSITDAHDGLSFPSLQLRLSPRHYQTDGLSFHLHNSSSSRDVIKHHRWFTFSIYAIQTNDLKNPTFFSTSSLPSTSFLSEEE